MFNIDLLHKNKDVVLLYDIRNQYCILNIIIVSGDRYTVGRSLRPVAVAYDPIEKVSVNIL